MEFESSSEPSSEPSSELSYEPSSEPVATLETLDTDIKPDLITKPTPLTRPLTPKPNELVTTLMIDNGKGFDSLQLHANVTTCPLATQIQSAFIYDHISTRVESSARLVLYNEPEAFHVHCMVSSVNRNSIQRMKQLVNLSEVICGSFTSDVTQITDDDPMVWMFCEMTSDHSVYLLDGFIMSRNQYKLKVHDFFLKTMYPCGAISSLYSPYNPEQNKYILCLDIDKTIGVTLIDAMTQDKADGFRTDIEIKGHMAISGEEFSHRVMFRNGLYEFMRQVQRFCRIYFITWGDIHYGRSIITQANKQNWKNSIDTSSPDDEIVTIPITHVFSRRKNIKNCDLKHFQSIVPFFSMENKDQCIAIDDDPNAWNPNVKGRVQKISAFFPTNQGNDLVESIPMIQQEAKLYFEKV